MGARVYCLGGLITDKQVFKNIEAEGIELVYIPYTIPKKNESLEVYAKRLFEQIHLPKDYQLLGVSFGGLIAREFSKLQKPEKLYLVSGIYKVPVKFRLVFFLKLHKLFPRFLIRSSNLLTQFLFGVKRKKDRDRIKNMLTLKNIDFIQWALGQIIKGNYEDIPEAIKIHGTHDRMSPSPLHTDYPISNGTHFIMANRTDEITQILTMNNSRTR